ncbi:uncharacterized [Tachysurus ichikawai]
MQRERSPVFLALSMDSIKLLWDTFLDPVRQETVQGGSLVQKNREDRSQAQLSDRSLQVRINSDLLIQRPLLSPTEETESSIHKILR